MYQIPDRATQIAKLKKWAVDHYDQGADTIVECWDDAEWQDIFEEHKDDFMAVFRTIKACVDVWNDRRADARHYQE